ncbi:MAG: AbrB/MazE/SpoVT family DNA-binding domain-containing protein [bacterium]
MSRTVQKWGNSLGVRIPKDLADRMDLDEGSELEFRVEDGRIILEPVSGDYDLSELVDGITQENRHDEHSTGTTGQEAW